MMSSVPTTFWQWTAELDSGERTGVMVLCVVAIVFIVMVTFCTIYAMHKNRLEDSLKRELLDRGMTADEIATIIRARPTKRVPHVTTQSASTRSNIK
jgi:hypothetical protein